MAAASGNQTGQLVLREAENVSACFDIHQHVGGGVTLADGLDADGVAGIFGMVSHKAGDLLLSEVDDSLGDPDLQGACCGGLFCRSSLLCGCGFLCRCCSLSAGCKSKYHTESQKKC